MQVITYFSKDCNYQFFKRLTILIEKYKKIAFDYR